MTKINAASVQFNHKAGDKAYNLQRITSFVECAAEKDVDLLVFPEMCITGYWHVRNLSKQAVESMSESVPAGPSTQALLDLSAKHKMTIGAGLIEKASDGKL